jgi:hypothetical protein
LWRRVTLLGPKWGRNETFAFAVQDFGNNCIAGARHCAFYNLVANGGFSRNLEGFSR